MDLGTLIARIEELGSSAEEAARLSAERLGYVIEEDQFAPGVDPYGRRWAPLKRGGASHLTKTGAMRASVKATASGNTVTTTVDSPAQFHQHGTSRMPARQVLPEAGNALPEKYQATIEQAAREVMVAALTGRRAA